MPSKTEASKESSNCKSGRSRSRWLMPGLMVVLIVGFRVPAFLCQTELNVDESLFAAQALRYFIDGLPWGSVDATTSGPINTFPFYMVSIVAGPWGFRGMHLFAAGMVSAMGVLTWAILRKTCCSSVAACGALSFTLFVACSQSADFVHFSSELIPVTLIAAATYCMARGHYREWQTGKVWCYSGCFLAGLTPWAKLQAAPISLVFLLYSILMAAIYWHGDRVCTAPKVIGIATLTMAFGLPTMIVLTIVATGGATYDLLQSYILRNLSYAQGSHTGVAARAFTQIFKESPSGAIALGLAVITICWVALACPGWRSSSRLWKSWIFFLACQLSAALIAVAKPPYQFPHYDWFLVIPSILLTAAVVQTWHGGKVLCRDNYFPVRKETVVIVLTTTLVVSLQARFLPQAKTDALSTLGKTPDPFQTLVSERIAANADGSQTLGIWGWAPALYIKTGLAPASRHAIGHYVIEESAQRPHFRKTFIEDIRKSKPGVFVDVVAPGFFLWPGWPKESRIESFPELTRLLTDEYRLQEELRSSATDEPVRIYVRSRPGQSQQ